MSTISDVDTMTDEWVKQLCFDNRVDLNLQVPANNESTKIEIGQLPNMTPLMDEISKGDPNVGDNYLASILSGKTDPSEQTNDSAVSACQGTRDCVCSKCQRRRRRRAKFGESFARTSPARSSSVRNAPFASALQPVKRNQSLCVRKPTELPSPQSGSSVHTLPDVDEEQEQHGEDNKSRNKSTITKTTISRRATRSPSKPMVDYSKDSYEISWKDEASGDDILPSLRTFQNIFEEKPRGTHGLSELLERKAMELRMQREYERIQHEEEEERARSIKPPPPPREDCCTLSYRDGPSHEHLTLYHTMKMTCTNERTEAYAKAFDQCTRAQSGLERWIRRQDNRELPEAMTSYTPAHHHHANVSPSSWGNKKGASIRFKLNPFLPSRKHRVVAEDLWTKTKMDIATKSTTTTTHEPSTPLTDVVSAACSLIANESPAAFNQVNAFRSRPYDHVDSPSRPHHSKSHDKDKDTTSAVSSVSISDGDGDQPSSPKGMAGVLPSAKIFASFGRRSQRLRGASQSSCSFDSKVECPEDGEASLKARRRANTTSDVSNRPMTAREVAARMAEASSSPVNQSA